MLKTGTTGWVVGRLPQTMTDILLSTPMHVRARVSGDIEYVGTKLDTAQI